MGLLSSLHGGFAVSAEKERVMPRQGIVEHRKEYSNTVRNKQFIQGINL
jgi:hypothetical protein